MIEYAVLFGCLLIIGYPALAAVVVEAFVELPSTSQVWGCLRYDERL
jgi:hypothetical protein